METNDENLLNETWMPIPSLNNKYEASNIGRFRNAVTKKVLKQFESRHGYMILQARPEMYNAVNVRIHRAVAEAFLGPCPDGYVVNHKDGNKKNNHIENLEYVTPSQNNQHALDSNLRRPADMVKYAPKEELHYKAKITKEIVRKILEIRDNTGFGCRKIAKMLGVDRGIVNGILTGRTWKATAARNYAEIYKALNDFMRIMVKLPYDTPKSKAWIDAFKGEGAYYTLKNLVMFHGCTIFTGPAHHIMYRRFNGIEAVNYLNCKLDEYQGAGYKMFALMKKVIADNGFDFSAKMREIYSEK